MFVLVFLSMLLLYGFIAIGIYSFGLLNSYSAYSTKWMERLPIDNSSLWSLVTITAAFLMVPPMLEVGETNPAQCLGFFVPIYLICVGLTPRWESDRSEHRYHTIFAILCAVGALFWIIMVAHQWYVILPPIILVIIAMLYTRRYNAMIFWGEMVMFMSAHLALLASL